MELQCQIAVINEIQSGTAVTILTTVSDCSHKCDHSLGLLSEQALQSQTAVKIWIKVSDCSHRWDYSL
jgi:hypothetical protein